MRVKGYHFEQDCSRAEDTLWPSWTVKHPYIPLKSPARWFVWTAATQLIHPSLHSGAVTIGIKDVFSRLSLGRCHQKALCTCSPICPHRRNSQKRQYHPCASPLLHMTTQLQSPLHHQHHQASSYLSFRIARGIHSQNQDSRERDCRTPHTQPPACNTRHLDFCQLTT